MQRDALYIADLVESTRTVRDYLGGIRREQWDEDRVLRDAVLYRLLLLGEIASALPDVLRDRYPDVAWRQIRAFRNLAVHKYFSVDWAVVWQIAQEEVPLLGVHSRGPVNWRQLRAGSGGSQGLPVMALAMASSAVTPWAAAVSR
jgi:uncharacterized protein with HEPN domain